jgi:hypothetical protein
MGELMDTTFHYVHACLFVPLTLKDRVMGMLVLTSSEAGALERGLLNTWCRTVAQRLLFFPTVPQPWLPNGLVAPCATP